MDHETNKQDPSSKEGGQVKASSETACPSLAIGQQVKVVYPRHAYDGKRGTIIGFSGIKEGEAVYEVQIEGEAIAAGLRRSSLVKAEAIRKGIQIGDKVWVLCKVVNCNGKEGLAWVEVGSKCGRVWVNASDCRPVEPPAIEACTKTANDQLRQSLMDYPFGEPSNSPKILDSSSEPLAVGDAVRFVSPGHKRHGTEGILKSIHHGPKNAYLFVSDCGQFHCYCTIAELEHYDKAETVDIKGSMQSLDGADTIQEGDLQWTDRDGKYRLCNFTIGMRAHEAIQRGKTHGEKWVFYRKFEEVGE
jgi:hypothetical protein